MYVEQVIAKTIWTVSNGVHWTSLIFNLWQGERRSPMFDFGRGDAVPLVKKVGGRRSPAFPLENKIDHNPTSLLNSDDTFDRNRWFYQFACKCDMLFATRYV
jgi:hypothetical protein